MCCRRRRVRVDSVPMFQQFHTRARLNVGVRGRKNPESSTRLIVAAGSAAGDVESIHDSSPTVGGRGSRDQRILRKRGERSAESSGSTVTNKEEPACGADRLC